jgi:hypothetical protein
VNARAGGPTDHRCRAPTFDIAEAQRVSAGQGKQSEANKRATRSRRATQCSRARSRHVYRRRLSCVDHLRGAGAVLLAMTPSVGDGVGTSDAFKPPAMITVGVKDFHGNARCDLELRDVATGTVVDIGELNMEKKT